MAANNTAWKILLVNFQVKEEGNIELKWFHTCVNLPNLIVCQIGRRKTIQVQKSGLVDKILHCFNVRAIIGDKALRGHCLFQLGHHGKNEDSEASL